MPTFNPLHKMDHDYQWFYAISPTTPTTRWFDRVLKVATIKPVVNQVELHAALPQAELRQDMQARNIVVSAYSPLGYGLSTDKSLMDDEQIQAMAKKLDMKPAQFLLSYVAQMPNVTLLTKSETLARVQENAALKVQQFPPEITAELVAFGVKNKKRTVNPDFFGEKQGEMFFKD